MNPQEAYQLYQAKMNKQLGHLDAKIQNIKAKASEAKAERKHEYKDVIAKLEAKQETVKAQLHELQSNGTEAFETLKDGVDNAWSELQSAFREAMSSFR